MIIRVLHLGRLPPSARRPGLIAAACRRALKAGATVNKGELNIVIMDRDGMRKLNKMHLGHGHDTDVIAFPYLDKPQAREPFGDVCISAYQARRQAAEQGHGVLEEVLTLAVHGTLHLLGYRDDTPRRRARMFRRQDLVLGPML